MSDSDNDNKFKEELEKELESGLSNATEQRDSDDFTVRVRREEYIVKRRFYDKDKALEAAESLRRDKRNLVDDTIEGQALSSNDEEDEKVDWDKLVDAGLEFDPPIAHAAEKKPGEPPVGLAEQTPKTDIDDKMLEKTLLVKRPKPDMPAEPDEPEEDVAFEDEEEAGEQAQVPVHGPVKSSKKGWLVAAVFVLVLGAAVGMYLMSRSTDRPKVKVPVDTKMRMTTDAPKPMPVAPVKKDSAGSVASSGEKQAVKPEAARIEPTPAVKETPPAQTTAVTRVATPVASKPSMTVTPEPIVADVNDHYTHTVHVSSYREMTRANSAVAKLKKKGYDAFTGIIRIPGKGDWYRVYVGYLTSLDEAKVLAETIKTSLREDALARKTPWAIQVGATAQAVSLERLVADLKKKGYAVNTVPVAKHSETVRILTGAFASETEASTMASILSNDGFSVKIVQR